jgi:hypothetical protein
MSKVKEIVAMGLGAGKEEATLYKKFVHSLENLQAYVGGYIEAIRLGEDMVIWLNEEGKLQNLEPNFSLTDREGVPYDLVVGNVLITGVSKAGEAVSLSDKQIKEIEKRFLSRNHLNMF